MERAGFRPDLILVELFGPRWFVRGLERCNVPLAAIVYDSALNHFWLRDYLTLFDHVFVDFSESVDVLAQHGVRAHWAPYAIEPAHYPDVRVQKDCDVAFVGSVEQRPRRRALLDLLRAHFELTVVGGHDSPHRVPAQRIADVYRRARIVINECLVEGVNFRVFEAMASGSLLLTEATDRDLPRLFEPGVHLATYTPRNVLERVRHFLTHESQRESIAAAGRRHVLARHTRMARARYVLDVVQREWRPTGARAAHQPRAPDAGSVTWPPRARSDVRLRRLRAARAYHAFGRRWPQLGAAHERRIERAFALADAPFSDAAAERERMRSLWVRGVFRAERGETRAAVRDLCVALSELEDTPLPCWQLAIVLARAGDRAGCHDAILAGIERVARTRSSEPSSIGDAQPWSRELGPRQFLALGELLAEQAPALERNASLPRAPGLPWTPADFLYRAIELDDARVPLRLARWHARVGDAATALILHEGLVSRGLATPETRVEMAEQALRCFQRERALDLLGGALKEQPELEARVARLDLTPTELRAIRPLPSGSDRALALGRAKGHPPQRG